MDIKYVLEKLRTLSCDFFAGVPDSQLKPFAII